MQANIDQFKPDNFITRLQTGLAANDTEKMNFLKKKYGAENATIKDGDLYYRKDKGEKFKRLDPGTLEVISDILPDWGREIVTEAALLPAELTGAALGAGAGGGEGALVGSAAGPAGTAVGGGAGAVAGGVAGGVAGRVAGMRSANETADYVAGLAGIPQDPNRNLTMEDNIGMAAEGLLPVVGRALGGAIKKRIPGTEAYNLAKGTGKSEAIALTKQSEEVAQAAYDLEKSGILQNIPGTDTPLMLHQIQPDSPQVQSLLKRISKAPELLNAETRQSEAYGEALRNTLTEIARRDGHGPVSPENLGSVITNAVQNIDKTEGKAIGQFRAKAMAKLGNQKQQIPAEVSQLAVDTMKELGFQPKSVTVKSVTRPGTAGSLMLRGGVEVPNTIQRTMWQAPKDLAKIEGRLGLTEGQTRATVNVLNEFGQLISRGNEARLTDVERMITRMGPLTQKLQGTKGGAVLSNITGQLRQFRREMIGSGLEGEFEKKAFNAAMDDFGMIRENTKQLSNLLNGEATAKTIVSGFFKGKENLANIKAIKAITGNDSPQWGALKEEFVNQLILKHASDTKTGFNSQAMLNDLRKNYGDDFIREVFNDGKAGPNIDTVKQLLTVGQRIEKTAQNIKADTATEAQKKGLMDLAIGLAGNIKFKSFNGITALLGGMNGEEKALFEIMQRDGIEKYVANYPGMKPTEKTRVAKGLNDMLAQYRFARDNSKSLKAAAEVAKRGTRAEIRQEMENP